MPTVSSSRILPKDTFAAWERWSPGALCGDPVPRSEPESEESVRRRAYAAGFEEGKRAGFQTGHAEGSALAHAEAARIRGAANAAHDALRTLGDTLSRKTVALAMAIARKIMQREIENSPESILDIVRAALTLMPDNAERVRVTVNTADVELVRGNLAQSTVPSECIVAGSDDVQRGGCQITSPCGDINATLDARIRRVLEVLDAQGGGADVG